MILDWVTVRAHAVQILYGLKLDVPCCVIAMVTGCAIFQTFCVRVALALSESTANGAKAVSTVMDAGVPV